MLTWFMWLIYFMECVWNIAKVYGKVDGTLLKRALARLTGKVMGRAEGSLMGKLMGSLMGKPLRKEALQVQHLCLKLENVFRGQAVIGAMPVPQAQGHRL